MIRDLSFVREDLLIPSLLGILILWVLFVWKDASQAKGGNLVLRAIVGLVALISLAMIALQPTTLTSEAKSVAVIITDDYRNDQLDSLKQVYKGLTEITYDHNGFSNKQLDSIGTAFIIGTGVEVHDFWQLEKTNTQYLANKKLKGITQLKYSKELIEGDSLEIRGRYDEVSEQVKLLLKDPGGNVLDSTQISDTQDMRFLLRSKTLAAGEFVYTIEEVDSVGQRLSNNPVPVVVKPKQKLNILIANTFPTFETKYLKNFLAEAGHTVLVRSQLTRGTYKFESYNSSQRSIYGFTKENLADFDLVIIDVNAYNNLSNKSLKALDFQVRDKGLGVFVQPDIQAFREGNKFGFRLKRKNIQSVRIPPWDAVKVPLYPYSFEEDGFTETIVSVDELIISAYRQRGVGKIATATTIDTYPLILNGNEAVYEYLWSKILSSVSKVRLTTSEWEPSTQMVYPDEPFHFKLRTSLNKPLVSSDSQSHIPLKQDLLLRDQWEGVMYPKESGWHYINIKEDSIKQMPFYVYTKGDWKQRRAFDVTKLNRHHFKKSQSDVSEQSHLVNKTIDQLWFFILFLMAMGYLWIVPRFQEN